MALPTPNIPVQTQAAALSTRNYQTSADVNATKDLAYKAFVVCHDKNILIDAWLPEQVQLDVHANYEAPYAQGIGGGGDISNGLKTLGVSMTTQALTLQVWQGGTNLQFSLPFIFQASSSGDTDVMGPIKNLMRLMMPEEPIKGGLLTAPGPRVDSKKALSVESVKAIGSAISDVGGGMMDSVKSVFTGGGAAGALNAAVDGVSKGASNISNAIINSIINNISLYVGQFIYFPSVVITDVSPTFDVVLGPDKNPIRASVIVQFQTFYVPTQNDIDAMFPGTTGTYEANTPGYAGVSAAPNNSAAARN